MALPRVTPKLRNLKIGDKPVPESLTSAIESAHARVYDLRDYVLNLFVDKETPGGTQNSVNKTFTLNFAPYPTASLHLYFNGLLQEEVVDYTIQGQTLTLTLAPTSVDILLASYRRIASSPENV